MVAGTWVLYAWFAADYWDRQRLVFATSNKGLRIARVLYGLALIPFGLAHFVYLKNARRAGAWLAAMAWDSGHISPAGPSSRRAWRWSSMCMRGWQPRSRSLGLEIGLFTLLVWVSVVAAGSKDSLRWERPSSLQRLTAGAWVVADSFWGL